MPNWLACGAKIARGCSQVSPLSVVRVKYASLRRAREKMAFGLRRSDGNRLRSQIW